MVLHVALSDWECKCCSILYSCIENLIPPSCFLLCLRLVSNILIIKYLHDVSSQMFQRWQSMIMALPWLGVQCIQEFWDHVQKDTRKRSWLQRASAFPRVENWQENSTWNCWKNASWQHHIVMRSAAQVEVWLWTQPLQPFATSAITEISDNEW